MVNDARLSVTLPTHPKTKKLLRRHGPQAAWGMVCLFLWAAGNRPSGDLSGMSDEDIELAIDWTGAEGGFVKAAKDVGFLDGESGTYAIHGWAEHNPYAAGAHDRSEASRFAALCKRYGREKAAEMMPEHATRMRPAPEAPAPRTESACPPHAEPVPNDCPASASVTVSVTDTVSDSNKKPTARKRAEFSEDFKTWYATYPLKVAPKRAWKAFQRATAEGVDLKTMMEGVDRYRRTKPDGISWAHPASWLNDGRWNDGISTGPPPPPSDDSALWKIRLAGWQRSKLWMDSYGPRPGEPGCKAPRELLMTEAA